MSDKRDTQWPKFEVFLQEKDGRSHKNVGSVHAPDAEMALLNARDVFGRRPDVVSLWVVPETQILTKTAEELAANPTWPHDTNAEAPETTYYVFQKQSQRRVMTFVEYTGEVTAPNAVQALQKAIASFTNSQNPTFVWWVCPASAIKRTDPNEFASFFAPAYDKHYKHPYNYKTFSMMRKVVQAASEESGAADNE